MLENGDTVITFVTNSGNNKTESEWKSYSTYQVSFKGGVFGIPEKLLEGSFHGGISADNKLAVTGSKFLRARTANKNKTIFESGKDSTWYNKEQACNVSMVQDGSKRTAFLDFGGKTGRAYVGKKYNTHQYLLIADSLGGLIQAAAAPAGYTFDHSEWAVGSTNNNVIATLTNVNGAHKRITLINLEKGEIIDMAEGDELWHPSLWIKVKKQITLPSNTIPVSSSTKQISSSSKVEDNKTSSSSIEIESSSDDFVLNDASSSSTTSNNITSCSSSEISSSSDDIVFNDVSSSSTILNNITSSSSSEILSSSDDVEEIPFEFDPDSAGMYYNNSGTCNFAAKYRYKMELLWQYKDIANVAILGSSRALQGVNPLIFNEPIFALNFAINNTTIYGSKLYFDKYILPHITNLKLVIISIDPDRGHDAGKGSSNMFYRSYQSYPGYVYDKNHDYWVGKNTSKLFELTYDSPGNKSTAELLRPNRGFQPYDSKGWGSTPVGDSCWMDNATKKQNYLNSLKLLEEMIQTCENHNIILIGVLFPLNPKYKDTGAYGNGGLRRSDFPKVLEDLNNLKEKHSNFIVFDENKMGDHDYTDEMANDYSHLSYLGAEQMTHRLDSLIKTLNINFLE